MLAELADLVAAGRLEVPIGRTYDRRRCGARTASRTSATPLGKIVLVR